VSIPPGHHLSDPIGLVLEIEGRVHDVPSAVRSLVFVGFFVSRLWRGRLSARELLRSSPAGRRFIPQRHHRLNHSCTGWLDAILDE